MHPGLVPPLPSAGLLLYRTTQTGLQVLLGHPGGPFWAKRDAGSWSIPKGEYREPESPLTAARREFAEETGCAPPAGPFRGLGQVRLRNGKVVRIWAAEGDLDPATAASNTFTMEWPPRSGRLHEFPELDRVEWFDLATAQLRITAAQEPFLARLRDSLTSDPA